MRAVNCIFVFNDRADLHLWDGELGAASIVVNLLLELVFARHCSLYHLAIHEIVGSSAESKKLVIHGSTLLFIITIDNRLVGILLTLLSKDMHTHLYLCTKNEAAWENLKVGIAYVIDVNGISRGISSLGWCGEVGN